MKPEEELKWLQDHKVWVDSVEDMEKLLGLYLDVEGIIKFPEFKHLNSLRKLFLSGNKLTKFSGEYPNLEWLILSNNQLTEFSGKYPKLERLELNNNKLTEFSGNYPKLEILYLDSNKRLSVFTAKVPKLEILDVRETKLREEDLNLNLDKVYVRSVLLKLCSDIEKELKNF